MSTAVHDTSWWSWLRRIANSIRQARHTLWAACAAACVVAPVIAADPTPEGSMRLLSGLMDGRGAVDGVGTQARFADSALRHNVHRPGIAMDREGNIYVADLGNQTIRKVDPAGRVTTLAGRAGVRGTADGTGSSALFDGPAGIAVDDAGNVFVCDSGSHAIRKLSAKGEVSTLAGTPGEAGYADGVGHSARFRDPQGIAIDGQGNLYVADMGNQLIRKVSPQGVVTTIAGKPGQIGDEDGVLTQARLNYPYAVAVDLSGRNIYLTQLHGDRIRHVRVDGSVSSLSTKLRTASAGDAAGTEVGWSGAAGIALDRDGNLVVAQTQRHRIRRISPEGSVTDVAGSFGFAAAWGDLDGLAQSARFFDPTSLVVDGGNIIVFDAGNATLRRIDGAGGVRTLAGLSRNRMYRLQTQDGPASEARFNFQGMALSRAALAANARGDIFVVETFSHTVRKVDASGSVSTIAGKSGVHGFSDGRAGNARFYSPTGAAVDEAGNLFVADAGNSIIRKIDAAGNVTTLAGAPREAGAADGDAAVARLRTPLGLATDRDGNLYVADSANHTIRKIDRKGRVSTVAGQPDEPGDRDGMALQARFEEPGALAVDPQGNLYVTDGRISRRVRRIDRNGQVSTPSSAWIRDASIPAASPNDPEVFRGLTFDESGNLYVLEGTRQVLWRVNPEGRASIFAGRANLPGQMQGPLPAGLDEPAAVTFAGHRTLVICSGNAIFKILLPPLATRSAGKN